MINWFPKFGIGINAIDIGNMLGLILKPGRYAGFNECVSATSVVGGLGFGINHKTSSSMSQTNGQGVQTTKIGSIMSTHGIVISTTDVVTLGVPLNTSGSTKYYSVLCRFNWDNTLTQPSPIFLTRIQADETTPSIPNSITDVYLGTIANPHGATSYSQLVYTPAPTPYLGGGNIVDNNPLLFSYFANLLDIKNTYNSLQVFTKGIAYTLTDGSSVQFIDNHVRTDSGLVSLECADQTIRLDGFRMGDGTLPELGKQCTIIISNPGPGSCIETRSSNALGNKTFVSGGKYVLSHGDVITFTLVDWETNTSGTYLVTSIQTDFYAALSSMGELVSQLQQSVLGYQENTRAYLGKVVYKYPIATGSGFTSDTAIPFLLEVNEVAKTGTLRGELTYVAAANTDTIGTIQAIIHRPKYDVYGMAIIHTNAGVFTTIAPVKIATNGTISKTSADGWVLVNGTTYKVKIVPLTYNLNTSA